MITNKKDLQNIKIIAMTISDLDLVKDTLTTDYDDFWNYNVFKTELENPNSSYLVAKYENEIIGFAGIWKCIDEIDITNVVVKKTYRNLGIGTILFSKLLELAKTFNPTSITLEVAQNNDPAIKIYSSFGFKQVGLRKRYYNNKINAIIMTKNLDNI